MSDVEYDLAKAEEDRMSTFQGALPLDLEDEVALLRAQNTGLEWQLEQMERINQEMYEDGTALHTELMEFVQRNHNLTEHMIRQANRLEESKMELLALGWREGYKGGMDDRAAFDSDDPFTPTPNPYEQTQEMPWQL